MNGGSTNPEGKSDDRAQQIGLEVIQRRKAIVARDAVLQRASNSQVSGPQALPPLAMAGADRLDLTGCVHCEGACPFQPDRVIEQAPKLEASHHAAAGAVAE